MSASKRAKRENGNAKHGLVAWGVSALVMLSGCSVVDQVVSLQDAAERRKEHLQASQIAFARSLSETQWRQAAQEVDRPWLAGRPEPLAREVTLPPALRAQVRTAMMFPQSRVDASTLAEQVTQATGIPVRVAPEVLLPATQFGRRHGGLASAMGTQAALQFQLPEGSLPLPEILDLAAARLAMHWRYADGVIHFYRTESQIFNVRALLLRSRAQAGLGRSEGGADGAFAVSSSTQLELQQDDVMGAVTRRIEPLLTEAGVVAAHGDGSSLIVITDTPEALKRVSDFLDRENRALTRRVRLLFEEVSVVLHEGGNAGVDWNLVYQASRVGAGLILPGGAGEPLLNSLQIDLPDGPWQGSRVLLQALSQVGTVTRHTAIPLVTLNRRPVTHAVRTTFSWIDKVQTTAVAATTEGGVAASLPSVSVSQKEDTVGQFLTLIPDAQEDGQVLLSIAYDTTVAQPLTTVRFGRGENAVEIQQLTVDGNGTVQQVELRPGQPMIVSGFDRQQSEADSRRLLKGLPLWLGGGDRARQQRETTLVIVTAMVEEGF